MAPSTYLMQTSEAPVFYPSNMNFSVNANMQAIALESPSRDLFPLLQESADTQTTARNDLIISITKLLFLALCFAIGLPTNLATIVVLIKAHLKIPSRLTLLQLNRNITDILVLCIYIPSQMAQDISNAEWLGGDAMCRLVRFARHFVFQAASNVVVSIAIDRYFAVRRVKTGKISLNLQRVRMLLMAAWTWAFVFNIPQLLIVKTINFQNSSSTVCHFIWVPENIANLELYFQTMPVEEKVTIAMHLLFQFWIPATIIFFIYTWIGLNLKRHRDSTISIGLRNSEHVDDESEQVYLETPGRISDHTYGTKALNPNTFQLHIIAWIHYTKWHGIMSIFPPRSLCRKKLSPVCYNERHCSNAIKSDREHFELHAIAADTQQDDIRYSRLPRRHLMNNSEQLHRKSILHDQKLGDSFNSSVDNSLIDEEGFCFLIKCFCKTTSEPQFSDDNYFAPNRKQQKQSKLPLPTSVELEHLQCTSVRDGDVEEMKIVKVRKTDCNSGSSQNESSSKCRKYSSPNERFSLETISKSATSINEFSQMHSEPSKQSEISQEVPLISAAKNYSNDHKSNTKQHLSLSSFQQTHRPDIRFGEVKEVDTEIVFTDQKISQASEISEELSTSSCFNVGNANKIGNNVDRLSKLPQNTGSSYTGSTRQMLTAKDHGSRSSSLNNDREFCMHSERKNVNQQRNSRRQWAGFKASSRAMKQAALIVLAYILCWSPYNILAFWQIIDKDSYMAHMHIFRILYGIIILNSVINPWLYGLNLPCRKQPAAH